MIKFKYSGTFQRTESFLNRARRINYLPIFNKYGEQGVEALRSNTPVDSSLTANSWDYVIEKNKGGMRLIWTNSNLSDGIPIAILIQYGHGTRGGSFVQGRDFINPAMKPIFDTIAENLMKEVTRL